MALWMGNLVSASITTTRSWPAAMGGNVVTAPVQLALFPAAAVMVVTPVPAPVTTPSPLTVAEPPLALQVKPAKGSARPAESLASALSASVLPASTGAVITSQLATDAAVGAATQVPPEQICPLLQSELLPQPGATQVPSSQTWPELQSLELKQTVTPWPTVAAKASVTTAAVVAAAATMIRINPSFHRCMEEVEFSCAGPPASRPTFAKTLELSSSNRAKNAVSVIVMWNTLGCELALGFAACRRQAVRLL